MDRRPWCERSRCRNNHLHWLDVIDQVRFRLAVLMYRCLHGTAPSYLMDSCTTLTADVTGRQHLRSATQRKLIVPRYRLNVFSRRRFAVAGPSTWNSLPDSLRDPELSLNTFKRQLKTYFLRDIVFLCALCCGYPRRVLSPEQGLMILFSSEFFLCMHDISLNAALSSVKFCTNMSLGNRTKPREFLCLLCA